jgi:hypothetical protein
VEARVRFQVGPCEISDGQSGTGTGFSARTSVSPCQYHSIHVPYSASSARCFYHKDKQAKPGNFPKSYALSETGENSVGKYFQFSCLKSNYRADVLANAVIRHNQLYKAWTNRGHVCSV